MVMKRCWKDGSVDCFSKLLSGVTNKSHKIQQSNSHFSSVSYSRSNSTESPASGASNSEPRLMAQVGSVREFMWE
jgi:hypothetical protein